MIISQGLKRTDKSLIVNRLTFLEDTFTNTRTDRHADYEEVAENKAKNVT